MYYAGEKMEVKMKTKNIFLLILTITLCLTFLVPSAWARKHRSYEGAAIFLGTAFLIDAFVRAANRNYAYDCYRCPPARKIVVHTERHYSSQKVWVPPFAERVRHKGHYNRYGRWIPGYWEEIHRPGHWR